MDTSVDSGAFIFGKTLRPRPQRSEYSTGNAPKRRGRKKWTAGCRLRDRTRQSRSEDGSRPPRQRPASFRNGSQPLIQPSLKIPFLTDLSMKQSRFRKILSRPVLQRKRPVLSRHRPPNGMGPHLTAMDTGTSPCKAPKAFPRATSAHFSEPHRPLSAKFPHHLPFS